MKNKNDDKLTVIIISFGEDTLDECITAIENQTIRDKIIIKHIKNISPIHKAKNLFYDLCETKYFVEVDADMILNKNACEILLSEIKKSDFLTYVVYGQLYEVGYGQRNIINCWKKFIFKYFKYRDIRGCDRDLHNRAIKFLLHRKKIKEKKTIGLHKAYNSIFNTYLKSKCDIEKHIFLKEKIKGFVMPLFDKYIVDPEKYKIQIFGLLLGTLTSKERLLHEKDSVLERKRLDELLKLLGYNKLDDLKIVNNFNSDDLRNKFIDSYNSYNYNIKRDLTWDVIKIFSNKEIKNINNLEKVLVY